MELDGRWRDLGERLKSTGWGGELRRRGVSRNLSVTPNLSVTLNLSTRCDTASSTHSVDRCRAVVAKSAMLVRTPAVSLEGRRQLSCMSN